MAIVTAAVTESAGSASDIDRARAKFSNPTTTGYTGYPMAASYAVRIGKVKNKFEEYGISKTVVHSTQTDNIYRTARTFYYNTRKQSKTDSYAFGYIQNITLSYTDNTYRTARTFYYNTRKQSKTDTYAILPNREPNFRGVFSVVINFDSSAGKITSTTYAVLDAPTFVYRNGRTFNYSTRVKHTLSNFYSNYNTIQFKLMSPLQFIEIPSSVIYRRGNIDNSLRKSTFTDTYVIWGVGGFGSSSGSSTYQFWS